MLLRLKLHGRIGGLGFERRGQRSVKLVDMATTIMDRTRLEYDLKRISVGITEIGFGCNYIYRHNGVVAMLSSFWIGFG